MRPPIDARASSGDARLELLHRARMFRSAAIGMPAYVGPETNWPAYALMLHACELALKAVCYPPPAGRPGNHDLQGWYDLALQCGLDHDPRVAAAIALLGEIHKSHFTRYPDMPGIRPRDLSATDDLVDALIAAATAFVRK